MDSFLLIEFFFCYGSDRPWTTLLLIEFFLAMAAIGEGQFFFFLG